MSPTTEDLRQRMAVELDELPDLPDLSVPALAGGLRRRRRRRYAVALAAAGVAVAAVAPVALVAGGRDTSGPAPDRGSVADLTTTAPSPAADPALVRAAEVRSAAEADGTVSRAEWDDAVTTTLEALLPPRFGGVELTDNEAVPMVRTRAGEPRLDLYMGVAGYRGPMEVQPGSDGCQGLRQAVADSGLDRTILDCADARFGNGFRVLAETERLVGGSQSDTPGQTSYAGSVILLNHGLFVEIGIAPVGLEAPVTITAAELAELARSADFLDLVRIGTTYARDLELSHDGIEYENVDPVWPE